MGRGEKNGAEDTLLRAVRIFFFFFPFSAARRA